MDWGYRCVLSLPVIEIMQSDLPHNLFNDLGDKEDNSEDAGKDKKVVVDEESIRLNAEAYREIHSKDKIYTVEEIFAGKADMD